MFKTISSFFDSLFRDSNDTFIPTKKEVNFAKNVGSIEGKVAKTGVLDIQWFKIDDITGLKEFNSNHHYMLVRFKNNPDKTFRIKYKTKTEQFFNNFGDEVNKKKIWCYALLPIQSKAWTPYYKVDFENSDQTNHHFIVKYINPENEAVLYPAIYCFTGYRYGSALCYINGDRIKLSEQNKKSNRVIMISEPNFEE